MSIAGKYTPGEEGMPVQWYLMKTWAGREEELVKEVRRTVPEHLYKECFVIYQERIWRKQQKSIVHVEPLFPGCVFLTCDLPAEYGSLSAEYAAIEQIIRRRELVVGISRFIGNSSLTAWNRYGLNLFPLVKEDACFLEKLSGKEHIVKLSYVQKDEEGNISKLSEPLKDCQSQIERFQMKKRYAMVRHKLWGEEQVLVLGILLKEDKNRIYWSGNTKIPMKEMA